MPEHAKNTILLIENHADTREAMVLHLEDQGYDVALATNGREAVEHLQGFKLPRLILLDLMMPEMNGWEFLAHRARDPLLAFVPVVIISAATNAAETAQKLGAADCLVKPFDLTRNERRPPPLSLIGGCACCRPVY